MPRTQTQSRWFSCLAVLVLAALAAALPSAHAARVYFNHVYLGTGSTYTLETQSIDTIARVAGSSFAFTSANPADTIFIDNGNNTAGTLSYITPAGAQVTVQGGISRREKAGGNVNRAFYFFGTGADTGKGYLFVEPEDQGIFADGQNVGTASDSALGPLNAFLAAQAALPVVTVENITVSEASPYVVFKVSVSNPGFTHYLFTPTFASGTATVGVDTVASWEYYDLEQGWYAGAQADIYGTSQDYVLVRVPLVNDVNPEGLETFTLSTGPITGGSVQNNGGAFGTATIADNGSSSNVFEAYNTVATPSVGTADNDTPNTPTVFASGMSGYGLKNTTFGRTLIATDVDELRDGTYFTVTANPAHGTATINAASGVWSFTPVTGYLGADSFTVTVTDDRGGMSTQVISVYVHPVVSWITWLAPVGGYPNIKPLNAGGVPNAYTYATNTMGAITLPDGTQANTTFTGEILGLAGASGFLTSGNTYWSSKNFGGTTYISVNVPELPPNSDRLALSGAAVATQTLTFDKPVANLVMNIWSMGNPTVLGSYQFSQPFVILSKSTQYGANSLTASGNTLNGFEGSGTIQFTGTFTELSWTVPAAEFYSVWNVGVTALQAPQGAAITGDISGTGLEDSAITGTLAATDPDGLTDGTVFTVSAAPAHGTASINPATGAWTYTPSANYNGSDSFTVTVTDNAGGTTTQLITLTVTPVPDAPVVTLSSVPGGTAVDEFNLTFDNTTTSFSRTIGGQEFVFSKAGGRMWAANGYISLSDGATVTIRRSDNGEFSLVSIRGISLYAVGSSVAAYRAGSLVGSVQIIPTDTGVPFEGAVLNFGGATVDELRIIDISGESNTAFDDLTIGLPGEPLVVNYVENAAPMALDGALTVGDVDSATLASGTVSLTANFAAGQDVLAFANVGGTMGNIAASYNASTGVLTLTSSGATATVAQWQAAYRAVTYSNTSDAPSTLARTVSFTVNDGQLNSVVATMTVTITPVNDAPVVVLAIADLVVNEDAGNVVTNLTTIFGDAETPATSLTYAIVANTNSALVGATLTLGTNLTLTFAANGNGTSQISVSATDGELSVTNTFVVTVTPVNDTPSVIFDDSTVTVLEDAGAQSLSGFPLPAIGPANESEQTLVGYTVTVNNAALFSAAPAINNAGVLTFTPALNANGSATVTVVVQDSGGTDNGGVDKGTNTFVINVTPVNDAPSVTFAQGMVTVLEDGGAVTYASFATFSPGPANESEQALVGYTVTVDNPALFSVLPAINSAGVLTYTLATNANGSATVTVVVQDNGTTANGGVDRSTNTFALVVTAVNDAPLAVADSYTVSQGDVLTVAAAGVLANDLDVENQPLTATRLTGPTHGVLTFNANGGFTYTPDPNYYGSDSFTYRATDAGSNSNPATVSFLVYARPTNAVPGSQTVFSGAALRFSATNNTPAANEVRVGDPDSGELTVSLSVTNGLVLVSVTNGLTFSTSTNATNVVMRGAQPDLNAALESLAYRSFTNYFGDDTLAIVTTDEGGRTNRGNDSVPILNEVPTLGGVPKVSLEGLNDTNRTITNVVAMSVTNTLTGLLDTNLVQGITYDPTNNVVNVLPMGGQDGSTNRATITVLARFSDGTTQLVTVPVIIYQPLLTATTNEGTYDSTFGTPIFNPQTSLYEQKVSVVNNTPFSFTALRITATNLAAGVTLRNASLTNGGRAYIEYNLEVGSGSNVTLTLEYYSVNRTLIAPALKLELLNSARVIPPPTNPVMSEVRGFRGYAPDGRVRFYIEFPTQAGLTYYVQYRDTITDPWKTSPVIIPGTGNRLNWLDEGAPNTDSAPTASRYYRIVTGE